MVINLLEKIMRTTNNFSKEHGQIQCNRGEQELQIKDILESKGYIVKDVSTKKSKAQLVYDKK